MPATVSRPCCRRVSTSEPRLVPAVEAHQRGLAQWPAAPAGSGRTRRRSRRGPRQREVDALLAPERRLVPVGEGVDPAVDPVRLGDDHPHRGQPGGPGRQGRRHSSRGHSSPGDSLLCRSRGRQRSAPPGGHPGRRRAASPSAHARHRPTPWVGVGLRLGGAASGPRPRRWRRGPRPRPPGAPPGRRTRTARCGRRLSSSDTQAAMALAAASFMPSVMVVAATSSAPEDAGEGEHVVDLVGVVAAAGGDDPGEAVGLLRGDLGSGLARANTMGSVPWTAGRPPSPDPAPTRR